MKTKIFLLLAAILTAADNGKPLTVPGL